jgi:hypothetical protein
VWRWRRVPDGSGEVVSDDAQVSAGSFTNEEIRHVVSKVDQLPGGCSTGTGDEDEGGTNQLKTRVVSNRYTKLRFE